jgi:hypothetical protein
MFQDQRRFERGLGTEQFQRKRKEQLVGTFLFQAIQLINQGVNLSGQLIGVCWFDYIPLSTGGDSAVLI